MSGTIPGPPKNAGPTRRAVLRGTAGAVVGLPLLDAMLPRRAHGAAGAGLPVYSAFVCTTCGVAQPAGSEKLDLFWPTAPGSLTKENLLADRPTRAVGELADYAGRINVLRGIDLPFALEIGGDTHAAANASLLTAAKLAIATASQDVRALGESIDNRIARETNPMGREPLALHTGFFGSGGRTAGHPGYCSYRGPKEMRAADEDPYKAYLRMVGLVGIDPALEQKIAMRRLSVKDLLRKKIKALQSHPDLSMSDRHRLDLHFAAIRELEIKLTREIDPAKIAAMKRYAGKTNTMDGVTIDTVTRLHMDLIAFAFASDYSRTATLKIGDINDRTEYVVEGVAKPLPIYHWVSHRVTSDGGGGGQIQDAFALQGKVDRLFMRQFKYFLDGLRQYDTPYGNLLDIGFAAWTNHMGNGNAHTRTRVPWIVAGSARGALKSGQFLDVGSVPNSQLFTSLLYAAGVRKPDGEPVDDFGDPGLKKTALAQILNLA